MNFDMGGPGSGVQRMASARLLDNIDRGRGGRQDRFLEAYRKAGVIQAGCDAAGVSRGTVAAWVQRFPDFGERLRNAHDAVADRLEAEAIRRAVEGEERPIYSKGEIVATFHEKSDRLLEFLLKGFKPGKYRDLGGAQDANERRRVFEEELARLQAAAAAGAAALPPSQVEAVAGAPADQDRTQTSDTQGSILEAEVVQEV